MRRGYVDTPEGQVHYRTEGIGEPVVLLHQTPLSSDEYSAIMPILSRYYRVVAMDTLGYGNSDKPPLGYEIEDYARNVIHFIDALDTKKTSLVGHHTGANIAVELAAAYPERVDKLVLSGLSLRTPEHKGLLNDPRHVPLEVFTFDVFPFLDWKMTLENAFKLFVAAMVAGPRLHDGHYASFRYEKRKKLPLISSPTLLIYGTKDVFYDAREMVRSLIPRCQLKVIENSAEVPALEQPEKFAQAILDFLANPGI